MQRQCSPCYWMEPWSQGKPVFQGAPSLDVMESGKRFFFMGLGGSGMSALAQVLCCQGHRVWGSDRSHDRGQSKPLFEKLRRQGIGLVSQDQRDLPARLDAVVVSSAIEPGHPQLQAAAACGVPVHHRAAVLAGLFNAAFGIGIAGTSGKTTVTGMVASVLDAAGKNPTVINGGLIRQYVSAAAVGNARPGDPGCFVCEVDESDGSIEHFCPAVGVVTNIGRDHKELDELRRLFAGYAARTRTALVVNGDCAEARQLQGPGLVRFGLGPGNDVRARDVAARDGGMVFSVDGTVCRIRVPGVHNVYNALVALAVGRACGVAPDDVCAGLAHFRGIRRRLEIVGRSPALTVVDDFAHNPDKIAASAAALRKMGRRCVVVFQPHGYGPTRFMRTQLAAAFSAALRRRDILIGLDIFDAGGTADRSISVSDLLGDVAGPRTRYASSRAEALEFLQRLHRPGDVVAVMGARDDTLSRFARAIWKRLRV